jgi:hypothetical protein
VQKHLATRAGIFFGKGVGMSNIEIAKAEVTKDEFLKKLAEIGLTTDQVEDVIWDMKT